MRAIRLLIVLIALMHASIAAAQTTDAQSQDDMDHPFQIQISNGVITCEQQGLKQCNGACVETTDLCCGAGETPCTEKGYCAPQGTECCAVGFVWCTTKHGGLCVPEGSICLFEPPPGSPDVLDPPQSDDPLYLFKLYTGIGSGDTIGTTTSLWGWAVGMGIGFAILNAIIGGFQIMASNGDQGKMAAGKDRFMWAVFGLILLMFAGVILEFINPVGFKAG